MAIVKVENKTYTVDPLYQWDKNQVLEIRGLSLAKVPEVHYTNAFMSRAIPRPASMDTAGIITTQVPNSLLQKASPITIYICTYEGDTFKTLYKLEIPVKTRPQPTDYSFEDDAGEIYSFNALEVQVANALTAAAEAKNSYNAAAQKETTAAQDLAACKALLEQAKALTAAAEERYTNALGTLNGVEDGSVFLKKAGDEMAGSLNMNGHTITSLADPEGDTDAVNKFYVDSLDVRLVTLWENTLLKSGKEYEFEACNVAIDLSHFSAVHIRWLIEGSTSRDRYRYFDGVYSVGDNLTLKEERSVANHTFTRDFKITPDGVQFEQGYKCTPTILEGLIQMQGEASAAAIVPLRISGLTLGRDNE